jgi:hypothetical protein
VKVATKPMVWEDGTPVEAGELEPGEEYIFSIEFDQCVLIPSVHIPAADEMIKARVIEGLKFDPATVPNRLRAAADLYEERNRVYGSDYLEHGQLMMALFGPLGMTLVTAEDFARYNLFKMVVAKTARYAKNFFTGGHADSLDDISVYAQMLREVDDKIKGDGDGDRSTTK